MFNPKKLVSHSKDMERENCGGTGASDTPKLYHDSVFLYSKDGVDKW